MTYLICLGVTGIGSEVHAVDDIGNATNQAEQLQRDRAANERQLQIEKKQRENKPPRGAVDSTTPQQENVTTDESCIQIDDVIVSGISLLNKGETQEVILSHEGKCLGLDDLNILLKQLTNLYINKGYVTSRAFLPEQDLADGTLEIVVIEGILESITIEDEKDAYDSQVDAAFPGRINNPLNLRDIEQGLDQLNKLRLNNATIKLKAGSKPGYTILAITRNKSVNRYGSINLNNFGTSTTGRYQFGFSFGIEDLSGINDSLNINFQRSTEKYPLYFKNIPSSDTYSVRFSFPYGYWNFTFETSRSEYQSQIIGAISEIDTSGLSLSSAMTVSGVIDRDQTSITSISSKLQSKQTENFILGTQVDASSRNLSTITFELIHSNQLPSGQLIMTISFNQGLSIFGAFEDDSAPAGSPKGQFQRYNFSLNYLTPYQVNDTTGTYSLQLSGQYASDNLFSSEQAAYGSYSTVRGLRQSVIFGNKGLLMRNDFSFQIEPLKDAGFIKTLGTTEIYTSIDHGHIVQNDELTIGGGNLTGATLGLRNRGGIFSFDISYSQIIHSSSNVINAVSDSGLFYIRTGVVF